MPTRFERWMRSKLFAMTAARRAAACPSRPSRATSRCRTPRRRGRRAACPRPGTSSPRRRSTSSRPSGRCTRDAALDARHEHQVLEADVRERAAHHHLVVAAARAVRVEVRRARRRARRGTSPPGEFFAMLPAGEMWSVVTESPSSARHARALRRPRAASGSLGDVLEERRLAHVGRLRRPTRRSRPSGTASACHSSSPSKTRRRTALAELLRLDRGCDRRGDLLGRRPDVLQVDRLAVPVGAERLGRRGRCPSRRRARRRRRAAARRGSSSARCGLIAALEVAVAGEHRRDDEVALRDRLGDRARAAGRELPMQVVQP